MCVVFTCLDLVPPWHQIGSRLPYSWSLFPPPLNGHCSLGTGSVSTIRFLAHSTSCFFDPVHSSVGFCVSRILFRVRWNRIRQAFPNFQKLRNCHTPALGTQNITYTASFSNKVKRKVWLYFSLSSVLTMEKCCCISKPWLQKAWHSLNDQLFTAHLPSTEHEITVERFTLKRDTCCNRRMTIYSDNGQDHETIPSLLQSIYPDPNDVLKLDQLGSSYLRLQRRSGNRHFGFKV